MLWTYKDTIDHLLHYLGNDTTERGKRSCRAAALSALGDLVRSRRWTYLQSIRGRITTVAAYSTGTIAYDHAGGSSERLVTLSSGTFPDWAASGTIKIGEVFYDVDQRLSSTTLQLSETNNPGEDVASGTSYSLFQDAYVLPQLFMSLGSVLSRSDRADLIHLQPDEWLEDQRWDRTPGDPRFFCVLPDSDNSGRMCITLAPPPSAAETFEFLYHRAHADLRIEEYKTGTVSCSAAATVTGSGTAWTSDHVGCVIRLATNALAYPTGLEGENPYSEERIITAVDSSTSITVNSAFSGTYSAVKYLISSYVDIHQHSMLDAYKMLCRAKLAAERRMPDRDAVQRDYMTALRLAMGADSFSAESVTSGRMAHPMTEIFGGAGHLRDYEQ